MRIHVRLSPLRLLSRLDDSLDKSASIARFLGFLEAALAEQFEGAQVSVAVGSSDLGEHDVQVEAVAHEESISLEIEGVIDAIRQTKPWAVGVPLDMK